MLRLEHLLLACNYLAARLGGLRDEALFCLAACFASLVAHARLNWLADKKLKEQSQGMNARTVEKFVPKSAGRKCFAPAEQDQVRTGDLLRLHAGQEVPCDCLILSVSGALHRPSACCQRGSIWDDLHRPSVKRSLLRVNQRQAADAPAGKLCSLVTGTFRWEYTHAGYLSGFGSL